MRRWTLTSVFPSSSCFVPFFCLRSLVYPSLLFLVAVFDVPTHPPPLLHTIAHYRNDRGILLRGH